METNTIAIGTLTATDIKALRTADRVSCHKHGLESWMKASKDIEKPGPFDDKTRYHQIACTSNVRIYSQDGGRWNGHKGKVKCFDMLYSYNDVWETVVGLLKAGDVISLDWCGANNNPNLNDSRTQEGRRLYKDDLYLVVRRGEKRMTFMLTSSVGPDNSARPIQVN